MSLAPEYADLVARAADLEPDQALRCAHVVTKVLANPFSQFQRDQADSELRLRMDLAECALRRVLEYLDHRDRRL